MSGSPSSFSFYCVICYLNSSYKNAEIKVYTLWTVSCRVNTHLKVLSSTVSILPGFHPPIFFFMHLYHYLRLSLAQSFSPPLPKSPFFSFSLCLSAHSSLATSPLPLPLLAGLQSRWVFCGCYDLRDDNGSYNVASRSWCGWACGIFCCVRVGDGVRRGTGGEGGASAFNQPQSMFSILFFKPPLSLFSLSTHPLTFCTPVVFLRW